MCQNVSVFPRNCSHHILYFVCRRDTWIHIASEVNLESPCPNFNRRHTIAIYSSDLQLCSVESLWFITALSGNLFHFYAFLPLGFYSKMWLDRIFFYCHIIYAWTFFHWLSSRKLMQYTHKFMEEGIVEDKINACLKQSLCFLVIHNSTGKPW